MKKRVTEDVNGKGNVEVRVKNNRPHRAAVANARISRSLCLMLNTLRKGDCQETLQVRNIP